MPSPSPPKVIEDNIQKIDPPKENQSMSEILDKAAKSALRGGTAGAVAMGANVACLMWLRTTVSRCFEPIHIRTGLSAKLFDRKIADPYFCHRLFLSLISG